jgi:DNA-binding transcriptional LysR family regulator
LWQQIYRLEHYVSGSRSQATADLKLARAGRLTPAGRDLLAAAEHVLDAVDDFRDAVRDLRSATATIDVACYPSHALLVTATSDELQRATQPVNVALRAMSDDLRRGGTRALLKLLFEGSADVIIANKDGHLNAVAEDLAITDLYDWHLVAVVHPAHPLYGAEEVELTDLGAERVLISPRGHVSRELVEARWRQFRPYFESESVDALFTLAYGGWGVAVVPNDSLPVVAAPSEQRVRWPIVSAADSALGGTYTAVHRGRSRAARRVAATMQRNARRAAAS